jgi:hypothetical protein
MDVHVAISSPHFLYQSPIDFIKGGFTALTLPNVKGVYPQYVEIAHSFTSCRIIACEWPYFIRIIRSNSKVDRFNNPN